MKKFLIFFFTIIAVVITGFSLTVSASSYPDSGVFGNNYYKFIEVSYPYTGNNNAWWTAEAAAKSSTHNGVNGHLATITSQGENAFLLSLAPVKTGFAGAWIGGKAPGGWLTGPEKGNSFGYANWGSPEPNNSGYAYMSIGNTLYARGLWVDDSIYYEAGQGIPDSYADPVLGYFVEYENAAAVPIPPAILLLGSGLVGIIGIRRKIK